MPREAAGQAASPARPSAIPGARGWTLFARLARVLLLTVLGIVAAYLIAALVLGLWPRHADFREDSGGTTVYLVSADVHADLVVPARSFPLVANHALPLEDFSIVPRDDLYLAFGWGDRRFYLDTPTWADLRFSTAWIALTGQDTTLMHVQPTTALEAGPGIQALHLSATQLAALDAAIAASFEVDERGAPIKLAHKSYGASDAFYAARGRYSAFMTCNEWVRQMLNAANVRVPLWSPFPLALSFQLDRAREAREGHP